MCMVHVLWLICSENVHFRRYTVKAKFHYAVQLASSSLAGRRPAREPARELVR